MATFGQRASNVVLVNRFCSIPRFLGTASINARGALHAWSSSRPVGSCTWILGTRCGLDGRKIQLTSDWCRLLRIFPEKVSQSFPTMSLLHLLISALILFVELSLMDLLFSSCHRSDATDCCLGGTSLHLYQRYKRKPLKRPFHDSGMSAGYLLGQKLKQVCLVSALIRLTIQQLSRYAARIASHSSEKKEGEE